MTPETLAESHPLMLTVSGCRGVVGRSLTPTTITRYISAFVAWLRIREENADRLPVVVARDGRAGGDGLLDLASAALRACGCDVICLDVATTPTSGLMVRRHGASGGIVLTASHNPAQWNGIKPLTHEGQAPTPEQVRQIIDLYNDEASAWVGHAELGSFSSDDTSAHAHVAGVLQAVSEIVPIARIQDRGFRVVLDSVNASGARGGAMLLEALGCEVVHLHANDSGVFPHTPEPTRENLTELCAQVAAHKADIGFAQDPDADRLAIVDDEGVYIGEEYTLVLACMAILETAGTPKDPVFAANLSTSRMIDDVAATHGASVARTPVGEANVVEGMRAHGCVLGGEGNGGVIWPEVVGIRDSLGAMALTLALLTHRGESLDAIVETIKPYSIVKRKQPIRDGLAQAAIDALARHYAGERLDTQDGLRIDIDSRSAWLHVRASNTEPILRLIAEAPEESTSEAILDHAQTLIASL
ncbi:MAG: phosphoglucosamine mutase [Phycisphaerales bacterium JB043]